MQELTNISDKNLSASTAASAGAGVEIHGTATIAGSSHGTGIASPGGSRLIEAWFRLAVLEVLARFADFQ